MWVTGTGYFKGIFVEDYLSIPANNSEVNIRWGEFCRLEEGRITEVFFLLDLVDLMQQAGFQVLPLSRGTDGVYPPPHANDGILQEAQMQEESLYSLDHIRRFIFDGLNCFDQSDLKSMGMADFFHPDSAVVRPGRYRRLFELQGLRDPPSAAMVACIPGPCGAKPQCAYCRRQL